MTKRHFKRFATAVVALRRTGNFTPEQIEEIIDQLAIACNEFNPEFNYTKFEEACLK